MSATDVERVLDRLEAALGSRPRVLRALDSMSNSALLIDTGDARAVLRAHTLDFGAPVTDHARELAIHRFAADAGLAPHIVWADADAGLLLTEYDPSGAYARDAFATVAVLERVAMCIAALHALQVPDALGGYTLAEAADRYIARADVAGNADTDALADVVRWVEADAAPEDAVLCHRDLLHANILAGTPVRFIDWEFASPGERWFDLASLAVWHALDRRARDAMLNAYLGRPAVAAEQERLARNMQAFRALCRLWELPPATSGS